MSVFLARLRGERSAQIAAQAGFAPAASAAEGATPDLTANFIGPIAPKKTQGLSGGALRRAAGDVFEIGRTLGIPVRILSRSAAAMEKNLAPMRALADRILDRTAGLDAAERTRIEGLP